MCVVFIKLLCFIYAYHALIQHIVLYLTCAITNTFSNVFVHRTSK